MLLKFEKFALEVDNVGAGENASHQHFLLPDNAYTAPLGVVKSQDCGLCCKELRLAPFVDVGHDGKILFINLLLHSGKSRLHLSLKVYAHWILHPNSRETEDKIFHPFPKHSIVIEQQQQKTKY